MESVFIKIHEITSPFDFLDSVFEKNPWNPGMDYLYTWKIGPQSIVKWLGKFVPYIGSFEIRSWENGNCSFDAVDFTVGLDPFGSQVPVVG